MPKDYPDFPHHTLIARYFEDYVDHFKIRERIQFNTEVTRCERLADDRWKVTAGQRRRRVLRRTLRRQWTSLVRALARTEDSPAIFDGPQIHSHSYIDPGDPVDCIDKNVVVVGMGNSALDIACELSRAGVARRVHLSVRRGYYVIGKYFGARDSRCGRSAPERGSEPCFIV